MTLLRNGFWLLVPILAFNLAFARRLPAPFQRDVFWKDVPPWIGLPENLSRMPVFLLPIFLSMGLSTPGQVAGLVLYLAGTALYLASWVAQIRHPTSAWSRSAVGFLAPALTPAVWLAGVGLLVDSFTYLACAGIFLVFHVLHARLVHLRRRP